MTRNGGVGGVLKFSGRGRKESSKMGFQHLNIPILS